ncbi:MAG: hypothetical protein ACREUA_05650 [Burkholderiales bacterium]
MRTTARVWAFILLMLSWIAPTAAEPLGRLFFTPVQRAALDSARQQQRSARLEDDSPIAQTGSVELNGMIQRSDGKTTLWINKQMENDSSVKARVAKRGQVIMTLPESQRDVELKVGQMLDMTSGKVKEAYQKPVLSAGEGIAP